MQIGDDVATSLINDGSFRSGPCGRGRFTSNRSISLSLRREIVQRCHLNNNALLVHFRRLADDPLGRHTDLAQKRGFHLVQTSARPVARAVVVTRYRFRSGVRMWFQLNDSFRRHASGFRRLSQF
jgi:hypothetical protein